MSPSRPRNGVAGRGSDHARLERGASAGSRFDGRRAGTAATSDARWSSVTDSASARARTVCGYGRVLVPRSSALTAWLLIWARSASSSSESPAASRSARNCEPNDLGCATVMQSPPLSLLSRRTTWSSAHTGPGQYGLYESCAWCVPWTDAHTRHRIHVASGANHEHSSPRAVRTGSLDPDGRACRRLPGSDRRTDRHLVGGSAADRAGLVSRVLMVRWMVHPATTIPRRNR